MSLVINGVTKIYKEKNALDDIQLTFEKEKIYGLLGRNGAGKSTLLNIISNRAFPSRGSVNLDGEKVTDNEHALDNIYLMSEDNLFPSPLKVKDVFKLSEGFYGNFDWDLANHMIKAFDLDPKLKMRKLSTGYRSIAKLITALSVPCDYIFLDEPVLGLDANHRELFYQFLLETYEERPRTFVLSTHLIEEIANLLEEVILIDHGKLIKQATVEDILGEGKTLTGPKDLVLAATENLHVLNIDLLGNQATAFVTGDLPAQLPGEIRLGPMNLQSYFVQLTKRNGEAK